MPKFIPIEQAINPTDDTLLWYHLEGYNGYELSSNGMIRSMKHYKKYPCGILIRPISKKGNVYELSNNNNERVRLTIEEIKDIAEKGKDKRGDYPRTTLIVNRSPRNQFTEKLQKDLQLDNIVKPTFRVVN